MFSVDKRGIPKQGLHNSVCFLRSLLFVQYYYIHGESVLIPHVWEGKAILKI